MLPNTLTVTGAVFTKVTESPNGTIYKADSDDLGNPRQIIVKHNGPADGKPGIARHLLQLIVPLKDSDTNFTGETLTVNLTVAHPLRTKSLVPLSIIEDAVGYMAEAILGELTTLNDNGSAFVRGEY